MKKAPMGIHLRLVIAAMAKANHRAWHEAMHLVSKIQLMFRSFDPEYSKKNNTVDRAPGKESNDGKGI